MAFTYVLTTDIGKLRFELGDISATAGKGVKPDGTYITDEEIQLLLDREGSVGRATAAACEVLARMYARFVDIAVGPRREALSQASKAYSELAREFRRQYGGGANRAASGGIIRADGYNAGLDYASDSACASSEYGPTAVTVYMDY